MQAVTTIGLDIAKMVFQVHGVDAEGKVIIWRKLKRRYVAAFFQKLPPCLVSIEASASSHHWSRELQALGHTVRLMPPAYVKPYVKRHKNDAGPGSPRYWRGGRPRRPQSRLPTRSREWLGPWCAARSGAPRNDARPGDLLWRASTHRGRAPQ